MQGGLRTAHPIQTVAPHADSLPQRSSKLLCQPFSLRLQHIRRISLQHTQSLHQPRMRFVPLSQSEQRFNAQQYLPDVHGREIGFIAEDFDTLGLNHLVDYEQDGKHPPGSTTRRSASTWPKSPRFSRSM
jgi:hypothetical protein